MVDFDFYRNCASGSARLSDEYTLDARFFQTLLSRALMHPYQEPPYLIRNDCFVDVVSGSFTIIFVQVSPENNFWGTFTAFNPHICKRARHITLHRIQIYNMYDD